MMPSPVNPHDSAVSVSTLPPGAPTQSAEEESRKESPGLSPSTSTSTSTSTSANTAAPPSIDTQHTRASAATHAAASSSSSSRVSPPRSSPTNTTPSSQTSPPATAPIIPYAELSAAEQAAQDAETESAVSQAQGQIDVDDASVGDDESDAGYDTDSIGSSSTSLASSVRDYAFENGRRYHKFREGSYNFPNDDSEQEREDMKHAMMINLCGGKLHFAPIGDNPQNVLDMGTGTGIWAIEMGDLFPSATILGVDLSPIQPEWVPPNVKFMVDDVESAWLKPPNFYDYIHCRHTVMAIRDWPTLMSRVLTHLKPGAWFECQEIHHFPQCHDRSMPVDPPHPVTLYWSLIIEALAKLGINFNATLDLERHMIEAGFVNVSTRIFHVPIGTWPKNKVLKVVGMYWRTILMDGLLPIALGPLTRGLKWSKEEVEVWLVEVRKAYMDTWCHSHMPLHIICGQKPR